LPLAFRRTGQTIAKACGLADATWRYDSLPWNPYHTHLLPVRENRAQ